MERLPNEILLQIFQKLCVDDLQASSTICSRWNFLITQDKSLVQKLPLVLTKKLIVTDIYEAVMATNHINYENLIIQYMKENYFKIIEKYAQSIKSLKIWIVEGEMEFQTALRIFSLLKNVERVQLYYTRLVVEKNPDHYNTFMSKLKTPALTKLKWVEFLDSDFLFFKIMEKSKIAYLDYNASYGSRLIRFLFDQNELKTLILWRNIFSEIDVSNNVQFNLESLIIYANNLNYDRKFLNFLTTQKSLKKIVYASHDHDTFDKNCFRVILNDMEDLQEVYLNINNVDFSEAPIEPPVVVAPAPEIEMNEENAVAMNEEIAEPDQAQEMIEFIQQDINPPIEMMLDEQIDIADVADVPAPEPIVEDAADIEWEDVEEDDVIDSDTDDDDFDRRPQIRHPYGNHPAHGHDVFVLNNRNIQQFMNEVHNGDDLDVAGVERREQWRQRMRGRLVVELRGRRLIQDQLQNLNLIMQMNRPQDAIAGAPRPVEARPLVIFHNQINTNTTKLTLYGKNDQEIVRNIIRIFPNLETLNLLKAGNIDNDFMGFLAGYLDCLQNLCIETSDDVVWSDGIKFKNLKKVHIQTYQMRPESLNSFFACNKGIEQLKIDRCCRLDDANFETIAKNLPKLKQLEIIGANNLTRHFFKLIRKHCSQLNMLKIQRKSFQAFEKSDLDCLKEILGLQFYYRTED